MLLTVGTEITQSFELHRAPGDRFAPLAWIGLFVRRISSLLPGRKRERARRELLAGETGEAELTELGGTTTRFIGRIDRE